MNWAGFDKPRWMAKTTGATISGSHIIQTTKPDPVRSPWSGAPLTTGANKSDDGSFDSATPRGYTGHEMLDDLGLVHMNGRIYDPLLGRFLSADILVQAPGDLQSYNRYTYVFNNPLKYTDSSGYTTDEQWADLISPYRLRRQALPGSKQAQTNVTSNVAKNAVKKSSTSSDENKERLDDKSEKSTKTEGEIDKDKSPPKEVTIQNAGTPPPAAIVNIKSPLADPDNLPTLVNNNNRKGFQFEKDATPEFKNRVKEVLDRLRNLTNEKGELTQGALVLRALEKKGWDSVITITGYLGSPSRQARADGGTRPVPLGGGSGWDDRAAHIPVGARIDLADLNGFGAEAVMAHELGHAAQYAMGVYQTSYWDEFEPTRIGNEVFELTGLHNLTRSKYGPNTIMSGTLWGKPDWNKYIPWVQKAGIEN